MNDFRPNWTSKPGDTISDILRQRSLTIQSFAMTMKFPDSTAIKLISGESEIDNEIAGRLASVLGGSKEFWLNRENQYREASNRITLEKEWVSELPISDMVKFGWINNSNDLVGECFKFFGITELSDWETKYDSVMKSFAYRTSQHFISTKGSLCAWLRQGEIKALSNSTKKWDKEKFADSLDEIKALTRKKEPSEFLPLLKNICAESGVSLVVLQSPAGCRASGASKFIDDDLSLIMLSMRYLSDDHFWFTFFHEAAHLILHGKKGETFVDEKIEESGNQEEREANSFAGEVLIPHHLSQKLSKIKGNHKDIIRFAIEAGVSPGIVVGQLQHYDYFKPSYMNSLKRRFDKESIFSII